MNSKLLGGILLITGTSIGGGMLALPIESELGGFYGSAGILLLSWLVMTFGAFCILEVNLWLPRGSNIISMAGETLGRPGQVCAWLLYLCLLYSLLSAYTASGADVLHGLLLPLGVDLPELAAAALFVVLFSTVVMLGIRAVDYANRGLMFGKLGIFILIVILISPFIESSKLEVSHPRFLLPAMSVMITSFGFANIIPSLRSYFNDDGVKLRKAVLIGSLIPLVCYIIWIAAIMGVLPRDGADGLLVIADSASPR